MDIQPIRDAHWLRYGRNSGGVRRGGGGGGGGGHHGGGGGHHGGGGGHYWGGGGWGGGWGYLNDYTAVECAARSFSQETCEADPVCVMSGGACIVRM